MLGWFAFLGAFTFLAYTDFALIKSAEWCGNGDKHCLREWIGALSGWAGAGAAAAALFGLYTQIQDQKRQTDFAVGNAGPTLTVIQDIDDREQVVIRVVNWNKRSLLFQGMDINGLDVAWMPMEAEITRPSGTRSVNAIPFGDLYLRGWEDRNKAPEVLQIKIAAAQGQRLVTQWPEEAYVSIDAILIAERHVKIRMAGALLGRPIHI